MPDQIFTDSRLVAIYDDFDGSRGDLSHYLALAQELGAQSVLDVGCGTGCFACLLSEHGFKVTGVDPAKASLEIARSKAYADKVSWILGEVKDVPDSGFDLAVMTGNVAQVFLTNDSWQETAAAIRVRLRPNGIFVFEARDPARKDWLNWTREKTQQRIETEKFGFVEGWCELLETVDKFVSFRWSYKFESDGQVLTSDSTLIFRERQEWEQLLQDQGFSVVEVRDAPDRPGKEFVFIVKRD